MKDLDKFRGCLIGGAAGDALGYPVEFMDTASIAFRYEERGITAYDLQNGVAEISDDTQMTLFTATGLLLGTTRGMAHASAGGYADYIHRSCMDWYRTQTEPYPLPRGHHDSWLVNQPEMFHRRAPGNTCMSALSSSTPGSIEQPINRSKGCGGVMRVAPIGLYFDTKSISIERIDRIGAEAAALTHGHSLGYLPAAGLVHIVQLLSHNDGITVAEAVEDMRRTVSGLFAADAHLGEFLELIDRAVILSQKTDVSDLDAIRELGRGWVAEETLAISVYCALKYSNDFDRALIAAVNHGGDSDSTGAVTGNIVGAHLGLTHIPRKYTDRLELRNVILTIADDLFRDCRMTEADFGAAPVWAQKYYDCSYAMKEPM